MQGTEARALRDRLHREGKRLVFTNGCFDLLHAGHVRYLEQARRLGDALVVGLNSDASVRQLKGPSRPLNHENDRAEVLSALRCVDGVVVFNSLRATDLIRELRPHVYAKGGDYTPESLEASEREALQEAGSMIRILPLLPGRSTTSLIHRASPPVRVALLVRDGGKMLRFLLSAPRVHKVNVKVVAVLQDSGDEDQPRLVHDHDIRVIRLVGVKPMASPAAKDELALGLRESAADVLLAGLDDLSWISEVEGIEGLQLLALHPSLLPAYPGGEALSEALEQGELVTGCTLLEWGAQPHNGRLWQQAEVRIRVGDTLESLSLRVQEQGQEMLTRFFSHWRREGAAGRP